MVPLRRRQLDFPPEASPSPDGQTTERHTFTASNAPEQTKKRCTSASSFRTIPVLNAKLAHTVKTKARTARL
jgi:hypothetical protein